MALKANHIVVVIVIAKDTEEILNSMDFSQIGLPFDMLAHAIPTRDLVGSTGGCQDLSAWRF
jgi:phosphatidylethanolamine-binding protein (PEBP) family uncharacterized protein